jgi:hypothetical protein
MQPRVIEEGLTHPAQFAVQNKMSALPSIADTMQNGMSAKGQKVDEPSLPQHARYFIVNRQRWCVRVPNANDNMPSAIGITRALSKKQD